MIAKVKSIMNDFVSVDFYSQPGNEMVIMDEKRNRMFIIPNYEGLNEHFQMFCEAMTEETDFEAATTFFNPLTISSLNKV